MARKYTKVEALAEVIRKRKERGETYRQIAESYGLERKQVTKLMERQRRKERLLAAGYVLRPKGRPRKNDFSEAEKKENELILLRMQVELLRNFLSEVGRR